MLSILTARKSVPKYKSFISTTTSSLLTLNLTTLAKIILANINSPNLVRLH